jgi:uncharacterized MAPEG superfamily protein
LAHFNYLHFASDQRSMTFGKSQLQGGLMIASVSHVVLFSYATTVVLSTLKASVLAAATASRRGALKLFINEEDAAWLGGQAREVDDPSVQRLFRAHRNELEAYVLFVPAGALYLFSGATPIVGAIYCAAFFLARSAHTYAYLSKKASLRRNAFTLAWLVNIVMSIHALVALTMAA